MPLKLNTVQAIAKRLAGKCMIVFHKLSSVFSFRFQYAQPSCSREALFEVRLDGLDAPAQQAVNNHIQLYLVTKHQVRVEPLKTQIPPEYIGLLHCWYEGKLIYQEYLRIQPIIVERKILVSRRIDSLGLPVPLLVPCNSCYP